MPSGDRWDVWGEERPRVEPYCLSVREAAAYLCVSVPTLRRWIASGELPVARLGRRVVVRVADLQRFCDERVEHLEADDPLADLSPREGGNP